MIIGLYALLLITPEADKINCAGDTRQMVQCAYLEFERAENEMNRAWSDVAVALAAEDARAKDSFSPTRLEIGQAEQKAWMAFRNAQCVREADREARGGTMYPLVYHGCRTEKTKARTALLRSEYLIGK